MQPKPRILAPNIRIAVPADATLLAELGAETFRDTFAADSSPDDMAAYLADAFGVEIQGRELADPSVRFLIAEVSERPVGFAQIKFGSSSPHVDATRPMEIGRIYARRASIGQGVGAALMARCLDEARDAACDVAWLGVFQRNHRAIAFYERWGFRVVGAQVFLLGSDPQQDFVMARNAAASADPTA